MPCQRKYLASVMVNDEALVPAVKVLMIVDLHSELLQHRLICTLNLRMHSSTHIIQYTHDARRILGKDTKRK